jgi:hypothetical protein
MAFQNNASAQGQFSGDLELNTNFFIRDSLIGAAGPPVGPPQYDYQKVGADAWLALNYSNKGFDIGVRFDMFTNSILINPNTNYTALGIGRFHVRKKIENLTVTAGYFYDQIGSGIIFRAYEARPLAIDNALVGIKLDYEINKNWRIKAFTGRQKKVDEQENLLETFKPMITGGSIDGYIELDSTGSISIAPGAGLVNRSLDDNTMRTIVLNINSDSLANRFIPKYNTYAATVYNTLRVKDFSWYVEGSYKTAEAIPDNIELLETGNVRVKNKPGYILYTSLGYAAKGFGATLQFKHTEDFYFRTSPFMRFNRGAIAFLPPMQRQNTYRLTARYNAAAQEFSENSYMLDLMYNPTKQLGFALNYSSTSTTQNDIVGFLAKPDLFREVYFETTYKQKENKWKLIGGIQHIAYNQRFYELKTELVKDSNDVVNSITPFAEFTYKIDKKNSIRFETQYMFTKGDLGAWAFGLVEFTFNRKWTFTAAALVNTQPRKLGEVIEKQQPDGTFKTQAPVLYPTLAIFYTHKASKFSLSYVKQPQGVVCTGGICRLEPAFSGVRFGCTTRF